MRHSTSGCAHAWVFRRLAREAVPGTVRSTACEPAPCESASAAGRASRRSRVRSDRHSLKFQYVSLNGHPTVVDGKAALQTWLDAMWAVHPPTLHVFDDEGLLAEAQDETNKIRAVFAEYDGDGNGEISLVEMTNMILEMDLHQLGVTKDEIANYVSDEFERVDTDGSGEIDIDEF